ncbi:MAG TPA: hypothetical protein VFJ30_14375 [Phycisphaerae bacterium]|nr:hypothetical protein [Phycisphaerae bacterium]
MTFNQREKILITAVLAVLALLVLDWYALSPLLAGRDAARADHELRQTEKDGALKLIDLGNEQGQLWSRMTTGGLKQGRAEAEGQILRSLRDWAAQAGVNLSSLRPEYPAQQSELPEIIIHAAGTGSMQSARDLLWRIESASIPVRVRMLQIGSRKDGADDLSVQIRVSTLYQRGPAAAAPKAPARPAARGREERGEI